MDILSKMIFGAKQQQASNLSADHFLAPQTISLGTNPTEPLAVGGTSNTSTERENHYSSRSPPPLVDTATLASADFDVDVRSGFLSPSAPSTRLSDPQFLVWELALDSIQNIIQLAKDEKTSSRHQVQDLVRRWKSNITSSWEILKIDPLLLDIIQLRRAHLVLAFLSHAFVHSDSIINLTPQSDNHTITIPAALAVPFCQISHALDIPPVLTYADTVLYNWYFKNPALGFTVSNLEITTTFTQTESEKHFYKTSVLVEALGPECLKLMRTTLDEAFMGDTISIKRIGINLGKLSNQIDEISKVLGSVREGCDPATFYWDIRPWFNGGKWRWEGVSPLEHQRDDKESFRVTDLGGPSAGQSTLIHAFDVFLGIDHQPNRTEILSGIHAEETFMNRMATYMPHHHRSFLHHLSQSCRLHDSLTSSSNHHLIRAIVLDNKLENPSLFLNYNQCVKALTNLRNTHTNIVSLFIISQKNSKNFHHLLHKQQQQEEEEEENITITKEGKTDQSTMKNQTKISSKTDEIINEDQILKGTGGTDLSKFLKRCKLRTCQALLTDD